MRAIKRKAALWLGVALLILAGFTAFALHHETKRRAAEAEVQSTRGAKDRRLEQMREEIAAAKTRNEEVKELFGDTAADDAPEKAAVETPREEKSEPGD